MTNLELAALFNELANIMAIAGEDHFKIRAYRNASEAILNSKENYSEKTIEQLQQIAGIGKAIAGKIIGANKIGTFPALEKWRQSGSASLRPFLQIPDLSMRKLRTMMKDLDIASIDDLKNVITNGKIDSYSKLDIETRGKITWIAMNRNESNLKT